MGFCLVGEVVLCWISGLLVPCFFCLFFFSGSAVVGVEWWVAFGFLVCLLWVLWRGSSCFSAVSLGGFLFGVFFAPFPGGSLFCSQWWWLAWLLAGVVFAFCVFLCILRFCSPVLAPHIQSVRALLSIKKKKKIPGFLYTISESFLMGF